MLNKKIIFLSVLMYGTLAYAVPNQSDGKKAKNYESFKINKIERIQEVIETKLFGEPKFNSVSVVTSAKGGNYFDYYFYKVNDENICLGIKSYNRLQDDAIVYINTQNECGTICKVYLDEAEEKQVYYVWEPLKKISDVNEKSKITIKTNRKQYSVYLRKDITDLEIFFEGFPKIKSIKGLENFPELINLSFNGINTYRAASL